MGWFSSIFAGDSALKKSLDIVDNAFYTDEERAKHKEEFIRSHIPFRRSQRRIATIFSIFYLSILFILLLMSAFFDVSHQIKTLEQYTSSDFTQFMQLIMLFYFGGGAAETIIEKIQNKK